MSSPHESDGAAVTVATAINNERNMLIYRTAAGDTAGRIGNWNFVGFVQITAIFFSIAGGNIRVLII
jgi:hypothetical protein